MKISINTNRKKVNKQLLNLNLSNQIDSTIIIKFRHSNGRYFSKYPHYVEILGAICYYGFDVCSHEREGYYISITVKKTSVISEKHPEKKYGFIISLTRNAGIKGKIKIYKIRTMYRFSEYLHNYMYQSYGLNSESGKIENDFRVTRVGAILRRYWLDELPMFFNLIRGDLKLVGVRPIGHYAYKLYPDRLKKLRSQAMTGILPPPQMEGASGLDEVFWYERKYLLAYNKIGRRVDCFYFGKFIHIFFLSRRRGV